MIKTDSSARRPDEVKSMFSRVANAYDIINRAMCGGMDIIWRRRLVRGLLQNSSRILAFAASGKLDTQNSASDISAQEYSAAPDPSSTSPHNPRYLDIACGSGDVAFEILKSDPNSFVVGADFCAAMLEKARQKLNFADLKNPQLNLKDRAIFVEADCLNLPFETDSFDGATISFGFRNFNDRKKCLMQIRRVLKKGSQIHCLEVARCGKILAPIQSVFMKWIVPIVGVTFGGKWADYRYLGETTLKYPNREQVEQIFRDAKFEEVKTRTMMFGFVAITSAKA